jgi:hypothetical protein
MNKDTKGIGLVISKNKIDFIDELGTFIGKTDFSKKNKSPVGARKQMVGKNSDSS